GGGLALPVAGAIYWIGLSVVGLYLNDRLWCLLAFASSGLIFPLGLLLQRPTRSSAVNKTAFGMLLFAALFSMLCFWGVTIPLFYTAREFVPLALGIGMSLHWPVIGWMFGRTLLFSSHAAIRAAAIIALWYLFPQDRFTLIPLAIATIYLLTALAIAIDVGRLRHAPK
ncbi:MAG: hypothetical protein WAW96_10095, partial [Alphaproteobacteria bacterium]